MMAACRHLVVVSLFFSLTAIAQPWEPNVLWDRSGAGDHSRYGIPQSLGDQNDDGYADFAVWALGWGGPGEPSEPLAELFHGGNPPDTTPYMTFRSDWSEPHFLDTVADWRLHSPPGHREQALAQSLGDLNGDGFSDFVSSTPPPERMTYVFLGSANPDTVPTYLWQNFWSATAEVVSDLNGDGKDELVFASSGGHFNVHLGRDALTSIPDYILNFDPSCYPFYITSIGDFNQDGYNDIVVVDDACNNLWGTLMLYLGHSWLDPEPAITIEGRNPPLNLIGINNAAGLGDVNGDHLDDFAIGAFNSNWDGFRGRCVILSEDTSLRVDADEPRAPLPQNVSMTIHPNPFNSSTQIEFTLPTTQRVSLRLYDVLGREVAVMMNEIQTAGRHRLTFDASGLPSGVYLCRLEAGEMMQTRKIVLLK
jgi:hypothetical protein